MTLGRANINVGHVETAETAEVSRLLLPAEAASRLGVCVRTLANWDSAGKLTARRTLGGKRRYLESEVAALAAWPEAAA